MTQTLPNQIREARKRKAFTQADIAEALGVTRAAVGQWESGATTPSYEHFRALDALLGLGANVEFLGFRSQSERPVLSQSQIDATAPAPFLVETLPVTKLAHGSPAYCIPARRKDGSPIYRVARPEIMHFDEDAYCIVVATRALYPRFDIDDVLYISTTFEPIPGDFVVAEIPDMSYETDEFLLKFVDRKSDGWLYFESLTPKQSFMFAPDTVRKLHRVMPWNELLNSKVSHGFRGTLIRDTDSDG